MSEVLVETRPYLEGTLLQIRYAPAIQDSIFVRNRLVSATATRFNRSLDSAFARVGLHHYAGRFTSPTASPVWRADSKNPFTLYDALREGHVDDLIADAVHTHIHADGQSPRVLARHQGKEYEITPQRSKTISDHIRESDVVATIYSPDGKTMRLGVHAPPGVAAVVQRRFGAPLKQTSWQQIDWLEYPVWSSTDGPPKTVSEKIRLTLREVAQDTTRNTRVALFDPGESPAVLEAYMH